MHLTRLEERMLSGEYGEALAKAMEVIVRVGEALGAERLVKVSSVHVSGISVLNIGEEGVELVEKLVSGQRVAVDVATVNPMGFDAAGLLPRSGEEWRLQLRLLRALAASGFRVTLTCAPYEAGNAPGVGEHVAWAESSAVAYANSVLGARSNREGGVVALAAALTGRIYEWGLHLNDARSPTFIVRVEDAPRDELEAGVLGYIIAEASRGYRNAYGIPVPRVSGWTSPGSEQLKGMLAAAAAWGDVARVVVDGVTPDWSPGDGVERISVDRGEYARVVEELSCCNPCDVDAFYIGCPHLNPAILHALESLVWGLRLPKPLLVSTRAGVLPVSRARRLAERNLLVLSGTCLVVYDLRRLGVRSVATNSLKAAFYLARRHGVKVALASMREMLRCLGAGGG